MKLAGQFFLSILYTLIQFIIVIALGFVFLFVGYLFTGLNKTYFHQRMPNLLTEICTFADLQHPLIHQGTWGQKLGKKSIWLLFICYYLIEVVLGTASYWAQYGIFRAYSGMQEEAVVSTLILCHQVIAFFTVVFLELLTDNKWTKQQGFARAFTQWALTWVIYIPFILSTTISFTSYDLYTNTFFIGGSFATSLILTNLLWTNIYSVMPWDKYKPFNGDNRCGNYLGLIFVIAVIQYAICLGFSFLFNSVHGTNNERFEGTWTILCYTWLAFSLIEVHMAEPIWKMVSACCKNNAVGSFITYTIICGILGIGFTAALYFIFTEFFQDVIIVNSLNIPQTDRYCTPGYWWAFSIANVYYTFWMMRQEMKHIEEEQNVEVPKEEEKPEQQVEQSKPQIEKPKVEQKQEVQIASEQKEAKEPEQQEQQVTIDTPKEQ